MPLVSQYDSPLRFLVRSQTRAEVSHLVDLTAWRGRDGTCNGRCSCEHFVMRLEPKLRKGSQPSTLFRCTHIELARDKFLTIMLAKVAAHEDAARKAAGTEYDHEEGA